MLAYIQGFIKNIELNSVTVCTSSGLGYEIIINELIYSKIVQKEEVEMFLYQHITENGQTLFGFLENEERILFKELIKISGVGGKAAQNILSLGASKLKHAIIESDKTTIEGVKGVGKKMAEKIILELSDKEMIKNFSPEGSVGEGQLFTKTSSIHSTLKSEILSTLTFMGYNPKKVEEVLNNLPEGLEKVDEIIPYVIRKI